jgi:hypothetical protein
MHGNFSIGFLLISLTAHLSLFSQDPEVLSYGEEELLYSEQSTEVVELFERLTELRNTPLNINCASSDLLAETGLLSPFQIHILIQYRSQYGALYSLYELSSLTGFSKRRLEVIAPYLKVGACSQKENKGRQKHMILLNLGKVYPEAKGFNDSLQIKPLTSYIGSPVRTNVRIKSRIGNYLSLGLTYEKDAGELFLNHHKPEFLSAYLQYKGYRQLKQVVIGNFKLHHGLGLVNGTGFFHSPAGFLLHSGSMMKIRPYSSKVESRYERGIGVQMGLGNFDLLAWASYRKLDLSSTELDVKRDEIDWKELFRESGLHRTQSENFARDMAFRFHSGIQGLFRNEFLDVGLVIGLESAGLSREGIESLGVIGDRGLNRYMSLHGNLHKGSWHIFSEFALSDSNSSALLAGVSWNLNDFIQGLLLLHHYGSNYRGAFPSSYAFSRTMNNERGISIHLQLEPGSLLLAHFTGEVFYFPRPRYQCSVPSSAYRYNFTFQNSGTPVFKWRVRLTKKFWQTTPAHFSSGIASVKTNETSRVDLRLIYDQQLQWQSRLIISYGSSLRDSYPGYAIAQQVSVKIWQRLRPSLQFVVFEVQDWDHRIYLHEPGLYYDFSFPVCYGSGQKITMTLTLKPLKKLSLAGKITLSTYQHRNTLGSGNDLILGNEKWTLALQLRLNL